MKKLLLLCSLALAPVAFGQTVLQRSNPCAIASPGVKTISCSLPKATTTGSTIRIIETDRAQSSTGRSASSLKGTVFTAVSVSGTAGSNTVFVAPSDGSTTFNVTLPSVYNPLVFVQEDTASATMDVRTSPSSGAIFRTPQPITTTSFTTTAANDYALFVCEDSFGAGGLAATGGWGTFNVSGTVPGGYSDRTLATAGSYAGTGTLSQAQYQWTCFAIAFKGTGNGPPPPPNTCSGTGSMTVNGSGTPLSMASTFTMPSATVGVSYSASIATAASVTGGVPPYTYSVTSGSLPAGLSMSTAGLVTGAPTAAGTSSFAVTVADSSALTIVLDMKMVAQR